MLFKVSVICQGIGAAYAAAQPAMHFPNAALQAKMAAGVPAPAVTVPKTAPAAEQQATAKAAQPAEQIAPAIGPAWANWIVKA